ncbi:hypothetical protein LTR84_006649 [Exophiala bonariae]|uniref:Ig-like domain-containing protein n=1 Tax=Exophiala bonariae TaxID=1690606 RepID=A0AAV9N3D3_9EURO|nr:hypothetical protein LTR84_006649 [Exophiala bonariae]
MFVAVRRLLLVAYLGAGFVGAWEPESTAIATVTPCPSPSQWKTPLPITVTAQYQPVSTCQSSSKVCVKNKCWVHYSYSTYGFVSTVIPCPVASPSSVSTITKTDQNVLVTRSSKTVTNTFVTSTVTRKWRKPITITSTTSAYTTIVKEWSAPYKNLSPFAIPGYKGSGICDQCRGPGGQKIQLLDVLECMHMFNKQTLCRRFPEVWVFESKATFSHTASAVCSTQTPVSAPGIYIFEFPQHVPPSTVPIPPRTATWKVDGKVITSTSTSTTTVVPGRAWTATITRTCARPTVINFEVIVTKVIKYTIPPFIFPNGPTGIEGPPPSTWSDWLLTPTTAASTPIYTSSGIGIFTNTSSGILPTSATSISILISSAIASTTSSFTQSTSLAIMTSSTVSVSSTAASVPITPTGSGFRLLVLQTPPGLVRRQDNAQYLSFDSNNNGIVVSSSGLSEDTLIFRANNDSLVVRNMYIGTPVLTNSKIQLSVDLPAGLRTWFFVGRLAQLQGSIGFCMDALGSITVYTEPDSCATPVFLALDLPSDSATSSTTIASSTTSVSTVSSSSTLPTSSTTSRSVPSSIFTRDGTTLLSIPVSSSVVISSTSSSFSVTESTSSTTITPRTLADSTSTVMPSSTVPISSATSPLSQTTSSVNSLSSPVTGSPASNSPPPSQSSSSTSIILSTEFSSIPTPFASSTPVLITSSGSTTSSGIGDTGGSLTSISTTPTAAGSSSLTTASETMSIVLTPSESQTSSSTSNTIVTTPIVDSPTTSVLSVITSSTTLTTPFPSDAFVLEVDLFAARKHRRAEVKTYMAFRVDNTVFLTEDKSSAAVFSVSGTLVRSLGMIVGSQSRQDSPLIKSSTPSGFYNWSFPNGIAQIQGAGGWCLLANVVYVVQDPSNCAQPLRVGAARGKS